MEKDDLEKTPVSNEAFKISIVYVLISLIWILFSDWLLHLLVGDPTRIFFQSIKGGLFAAGTGLLIYFLVQKALIRTENIRKRHVNELEQIFRTMPEALIYTDPERRIVRVNPAFIKIFGYLPEEVLGRKTEILYAYQEDFIQQGQQRYNLETNQVLEPYEVTYRRKNGEEFPSETVGSPIRDCRDQVVGMLGLVRDITERKKSEGLLLARMKLSEQAQDGSLDDLRQTALDFAEQYTDSSIGFFHCVNPDQETLTLQSWSTRTKEQMCRIPANGAHYPVSKAGVWIDCIFTREPVIHNDYGALTHKKGLPEGHPELIRELVVPIVRGDEVVAIMGVGNKVIDYTQRDIEIVQSLSSMATDQIERRQAQQKQIEIEDQLRQNQEQLKHLAYHDPLTDLPNRLLFREHLSKSLAVSRRTQKKVAVLLLDLDRFKNINDSLGHQAGDKVLREIADRLSYWIRESDTVARLGGDEFGIILNQIDEIDHVPVVVKRMLSKLPQPIQVDANELTVTGSLGISVFPDDAGEEESLVKFADAAMYRAKKSGGNDFHFYTPDMNARTQELLRMETALRKALERDEFLLFFQPLINLSDKKVVAVEALLRWNHPSDGMISPADFIPLAEETGMIVPIGEWVLETACRRARLWQNKGLPPFRIAVNISGRQFREADFVDKVERILNETGLDSHFLELEITESMVMDNFQKAIMVLTDLKMRGVFLSIDDFGTGYSSLSYLKKFPIDSLKIDRSFIQGITTDSNDLAIASSIIALAHSMGLTVVGEGIETEEQLRVLKERGCDLGQGYLFSHPIPDGEIVREILRWEEGGNRRIS